MISRKELDVLYQRNLADKRALDMLDNLMCAYDTDSDFQTEVLKVMEKLNAPTGTFGILCMLSTRSRKDAEDMFALWYESVDIANLSEEVFLAIVSSYCSIKNRS